MKKPVPLALILILLFSMTGHADIHAQKMSKISSGIEWQDKTFNYGKIPQGHPVVAEFHFKNPSMVPLIIFAVNPSCGCTVADYPKEPIAPQKTGTIKVTFDAENTGFFQKSVLVDTNAGEESETLIIKGEVIQ